MVIWFDGALLPLPRWGIAMDNEKLSGRTSSSASPSRRHPPRPSPTDVAGPRQWYLVCWWERDQVGVVALERMGINIDKFARREMAARGNLRPSIRKQAGPPEYQTLPSASARWKSISIRLSNRC